MWASKHQLKDLESYVENLPYSVSFLKERVAELERRIHRLEYPPLESTEAGKWTLQRAEDLATTKELLHLLIKELGYEVKGPEVKGRSLVKVAK